MQTVFTATAYYGNALPSYQWLVNGVPVGTDSPIFYTSTITNGCKVECILTIPTPSCPEASRSATSQMNIYVYPMIHPAIIITPSKTQICRGEEVTFTATANGGAYPTFTWMINGIQTGASTPSLTTNTLHEGDTVSCIITIDQDSRCHTTTTSAPSNTIVIHVHDFIDPSVHIVAPILDVCSGTNVVFNATSQNAGDYKFYQWQVNGNYAANNSSTFINNQFSNGDKVVCILTTNIAGCPFNATVFSNDEVVTVRALPVITFSPSAITIMSGGSAQLHASVSGSAVTIMWNPAAALLTPLSLTSSTVPLMHDTVFNLTVVDINGCTTTKDLVVKVLHQLFMPTAFTPNKDGTNDLFRIPAGASIILQEFSIFHRWGNVVFKTTDVTKGWNGKYQGLDLDAGTYVYIIKGIVKDKEVIIKGIVTLLR